jgi:hypothetical protein
MAMKKFALLAALAAIPVAAESQSGTRAEILVLGTYHMASPRRDVFNMNTDDVTAPKRQAEIAQVVEALKKFRPTKIAVESDAGTRQVPQAYADYLAGKHALTQSETEQIGFRLAMELGHRTIYPVNEPGDFPLQHVINYAKANGRSAKFDSLMAKIGVRVKEQDEFLRTHTILETLGLMNSDAMVARDVGENFAFAQFSDPGDYAGADLLAMWYQRNIRIYANIVNLIDSPGERILVIYGAGHLGWLREDAINDPAVKLRTLAEYAGQK